MKAASGQWNSRAFLGCSRAVFKIRDISLSSIRLPFYEKLFLKLDLELLLRKSEQVPTEV